MKPVTIKQENIEPEDEEDEGNQTFLISLNFVYLWKVD